MGEIRAIGTGEIRLHRVKSKALPGVKSATRVADNRVKFSPMAKVKFAPQVMFFALQKVKFRASARSCGGLYWRPIDGEGASTWGILQLRLRFVQDDGARMRNEE